MYEFDLPQHIVELAQGLYEGIGADFALADALEELGLLNMADHFRQFDHFQDRGLAINCDMVDALRGKTTHIPALFAEELRAFSSKHGK